MQTVSVIKTTRTTTTTTTFEISLHLSPISHFSHNKQPLSGSWGVLKLLVSESKLWLTLMRWISVIVVLKKWHVSFDAQCIAALSPAIDCTFSYWQKLSWSFNEIQSHFWCINQMWLDQAVLAYYNPEFWKQLWHCFLDSMGEITNRFWSWSDAPNGEK